MSSNISRPLQIVMPMAGRGQRFRNQGESCPKPLIEVHGQPLFWHALASLQPLWSRVDLNAEITFVIAREDMIKDRIQRWLDQLAPGLKYHLIEIHNRTNGPAATVALSQKSGREGAGLLSLDCDLHFSSTDFFKAVAEALKNEKGIDGALCTFPAEDPRYSFVQQDESGQVLKIAEKIKISNQAIAGAYFFSRAEDYFSNYAELVAGRNDQTKEVFVSEVIAQMLKRKARFRAFASQRYQSFGTPEELRGEFGRAL